MSVAGIDIGSRFIKCIVLEDDKVILETWVDTGYEPKQTCESILNEYQPEAFTVTGYGRQLFENEDCNVITEIKAVAIGAFHFYPECRSIVDIGGQDTKAITLSKTGLVVDLI